MREIDRIFPSAYVAEVGNRNLDIFAERLDREMVVAKAMVERRMAGEKIQDFDIRGPLYETALELAPESRKGDIERMHEWIRPQQGEISIDVAAGTGFLTRPVAEWTGSRVYAVDPSKEPLAILARQSSPLIKLVLGSIDDESVLSQIESEVDFVTSFGGLHHVPDQRKMMENLAKVLRVGGRFTAADVQSNTPLSEHFDKVVAEKCITGHTAQWLDEERLIELTQGLPLKVKKAELLPLTWDFDSERQLALFFKGLHAYDLPEAEILVDLKEELGYEFKDGKVKLNWPMIFFEIEKV